ncbi:MAG: hypothetical protein K5864_04305 [Bacteroidales bacterium]|nr:hypothetical protein [Bacteroidales bacterium]
MVQIKKIEEVSNRSKFDVIVKFDTRTIVKSDSRNLAELRTKGRTCYFHVIEKCSRERTVKLVHSYVKRMNGEFKTAAAGL